jgi:hypothetical protein
VDPDSVEAFECTINNLHLRVSDCSVLAPVLLAARGSGLPEVRWYDVERAGRAGVRVVFCQEVNNLDLRVTERSVLAAVLHAARGSGSIVDLRDGVFDAGKEAVAVILVPEDNNMVMRMRGNTPAAVIMATLAAARAPGDPVERLKATRTELGGHGTVAVVVTRQGMRETVVYADEPAELLPCRVSALENRALVHMFLDVAVLLAAQRGVRLVCTRAAQDEHMAAAGWSPERIEAHHAATDAYYAEADARARATAPQVCTQAAQDEHMGAAGWSPERIEAHHAATDAYYAEADARARAGVQQQSPSGVGAHSGPQEPGTPPATWMGRLCDLAPCFAEERKARPPARRGVKRRHLAAAGGCIKPVAGSSAGLDGAGRSEVPAGAAPPKSDDCGAAPQSKQQKLSAEPFTAGAEPTGAPKPPL